MSAHRIGTFARRMTVAIAMAAYLTAPARGEEPYPSRLITIVAHNVVNRAYLAQLMGMPLARYRSIPQDNCGVTLVRYRKARVKAVTINGVFHLGES